MHSFHQSRGRILFEVACALTISASCVVAWMQTYASAFLPAAAVAALYGLVHAFDLARPKPRLAADPPSEEIAAASLKSSRKRSRIRAGGSGPAGNRSKSKSPRSPHAKALGAPKLPPARSATRRSRSRCKLQLWTRSRTTFPSMLRKLRRPGTSKRTRRSRSRPCSSRNPSSASNACSAAARPDSPAPSAIARDLGLRSAPRRLS